jgi:pimeloyl-ACP methyl ester carboxylesterase
MWTQRRFDRDKGIFAIEEKPDHAIPKELILTLPGLGQAMSEKNYFFSNLRKRLAMQEHWVIQFDYRGLGDSYGELGEANLSTMLSDTLEVLSSVTKDYYPERVFLIGNALGAFIAQRAAIKWEEGTGIMCIPILISPPLEKLPRYQTIIPSKALQLLKLGEAIDSQQLVPGFDYYTLEDFDSKQYQYFTSLGAHMLYLHGQCIGKSMLEDLNDIGDPVELFNRNLHGVHVICGELDTITQEKAKGIQDCKLHLLKNVTHYYRHPSAMDQAISIVESLINDSKKEGERIED